MGQAPQREALTRGPHPGRPDRAEPLANRPAHGRVQGGSRMARTLRKGGDRVTRSSRVEGAAALGRCSCWLRHCWVGRCSYGKTATTRRPQWPATVTSSSRSGSSLACSLSPSESSCGSSDAATPPRGIVEGRSYARTLVLWCRSPVPHRTAALFAGWAGIGRPGALRLWSGTVTPLLRQVSGGLSRAAHVHRGRDRAEPPARPPGGTGQMVFDPSRYSSRSWWLAAAGHRLPPRSKPRRRGRRNAAAAAVAELVAPHLARTWTPQGRGCRASVRGASWKEDATASGHRER